MGQYVLLKYPKKPPDKLSALYRGTLEIVALRRPDIVNVKDLTTEKVSVVHTSRLRLFKLIWRIGNAGRYYDVDEYFLESIVDHE